MNTWPGWKTIRELGKGSFGSVYEIQNEKYGYKSALKVLSFPKDQDQIDSIKEMGIRDHELTTYYKTCVESLSKEIALMSSLKGISNIVSYEDHLVIPREGEFGWDILIRMELLTPLKKYLANHPFSKEDVARMGIDLCKALEACYKKGILHRDIKPANIFVSNDGNFKLGDFGVSRTIEQSGQASTRVGTYPYMAPEIIKGRPYNHTADLYSLALVLYQYVNNGKLPFFEKSDGSFRDITSVLEIRVSGQPVPLPCGGDSVLNYIILKTLEADPSKRFKNATELRRALEQYLDKKYVPVDDSPTIVQNIQNQTVKPQPKQVYCPHCGASVMEGVRYCGRCGKDMYAPIKKSSNTIPIIVATVLGVVILALVILLVFPKKGESQVVEATPTQTNEVEDQNEDVSTEEDTEIKEIVIDRSHDFTYLPADGQSVYFGVYEQDGNEENGPEPIEWITLNIESGIHAGEALLVSKYVLDIEEYGQGDVAWVNSNLRNWLNNDFYNTAFDQTEKSRILFGQNANEALSIQLGNGQTVSTINGGATQEYVTILRPGNNALDYYVSYGLVNKNAYATPYAWQKYTSSEIVDTTYHKMGYAVRGMGYAGPFVNDQGVYTSDANDMQRYGVRPCIFVQ